MPIYYVAIIQAALQPNPHNHVISNGNLESELPEDALRIQALTLVNAMYADKNPPIQTTVIDSYYGPDIHLFRDKQNQYLLIQ